MAYVYDVQLPDGRIIEVEHSEPGMEKAASEFVKDQYDKGEYSRGVVGETVAWMSGSDKDPSIPLLTDAGLDADAGQKARIAALLATGYDDERLREGLSNIVPEIYFERDAFGNDVAIVPTARDEQGNAIQYDKRYVNPRGLDEVTGAQVGLAATAATPIGRAVRAVGAPTTGVIGAGILGATEAGIMEGISSTAGGQSFRPMEVPVGAFGGTVGDAAGNLIGKVVTRAASKVGFGRTARQAVEETLKEGGVDPAIIPAEAMNDMVAQVNSGSKPGEVIAETQAGSLPVPIPVTKGQVTGDEGRQIFEGEALKGTQGEPARQIMQGVQTQQEAAVRENIPAIQQQLAGPGGSVVARQEGGALAQESLVAQQQQAAKEAGELYDVARGREAFIDPDSGAKIAESLVSGLSEGFTPVTAPKAFSLADEMAGILAEGRSVGDIFAYRSKISNLAAEGGTESGAARQLLNSFDERMGEISDQRLLYGDAKSIDAWVSAISNYRDYMRTWNTEGILKDLTTTVTRDGDTVLKVAPEEAANAILGTGLAGMPNKRNIARDILTLKKSLPEPEWNSIRQEVFLRLTDGLFMTGREGGFTGVSFRKQWNNLKTKNKTLVNSLFNDDERVMIDAFAGTVARISGSAKNTSNTAAALSGMLPRLANSLGVTDVMQFATNIPILAGFRAALGTARAATPGRRSAPITPFREAGAGIGATQMTEQDIEAGYDNIRSIIQGIAP